MKKGIIAIIFMAMLLCFSTCIFAGEDAKVLPIWEGTDIPYLDGEEIPSDDATPTAVIWLLEEQSQVKGNLFVVDRESEEYPAVDIFHNLGYNIFLLRPRLEPYAKEDTYMDFNRFVKAAKYYIMEQDLGGQDLYAVLGWYEDADIILSGSVNDLYGIRNASVFDPDYLPDEVDEISSDVDVAMVIDGAAIELRVTPEENQYLPGFYICVSSDEENTLEVSNALYEKAQEYDLPAMLDFVDDEDLWPDQADAFLQAHKNFQHNRSYWYLTGIPAFIEETEKESEAEDFVGNEGSADIEEHGQMSPEKYTKAKSFYGFYTFTNSDVFFAMNDEETEFYAEYTVMHSPNVIEGIVENGEVTVIYNALGFADDDAQLMYEDAVYSEDPWEPIIR